jgi:hypothetical protein
MHRSSPATPGDAPIRSIPWPRTPLEQSSALFARSISLHHNDPNSFHNVAHQLLRTGLEDEAALANSPGFQDVLKALQDGPAPYLLLPTAIGATPT